MPKATVREEHDRLDVVDFLAALHPDRSVTGLRRLVGSGHVRVNGVAAQARRIVRTGDVVTYPDLDAYVPAYVPREEPPRILWRRDDLLVVDKPAGVSVLPERGGTAADSLLTRLLPLLEPGERVYPVHRLDKGTSGVMLVATSRRRARELSLLFAAQRVEKTYRALVRGVVFEDEGTIDMPLSRRRRQGQEVRVDFRSGKPAVTRFQVVERFRGFTELLLFPETGRTHQLRVHLKAIGFPLAVDPLYGSPHGVRLSEFKRDYVAKRGQPEKPLLNRLALHAERIAFPDPDTGHRVAVTSPLPKDFRITLAKLRKWGRLAP